MGDEVDPMAFLEQKKKEMAAMQEAANMAKEQALALLQLQRRVAEIDALANGGPELEPLPGEYGMEAPEADLLQASNAAPAYTSASQGGMHTQSTPPRSSNAPAVRTSLSMEDRRRFGLDEDPPGIVHNSPLPDVGLSPISGRLSPTWMNSPAVDASSAVGMRLGKNRGGSRTGAAVSAVLNAPSEATAQLHSPVRASGGLANTVHQQPASRAVPPRPPRWSSLSAEDRRRFGLDADGDEASPSKAPTSNQLSIQRLPAGYPAEAQAAFHHPDVLWGSAGTSADAGMTPSMSKTLAQLEAVGATKLVADLRESERRLQSLKMSG